MTGLLSSFALTSTLVLCSAWLAARLLQGASADLRHRVWLAALISLPFLLLPLPMPEQMRIAVGVALPRTAFSTMASQRNLPSLLTVLWAAGAVLLLARFAIDLARLIALTRAGHPTETPSVLRSASATTPMTWGIVSPVILLPAYAFEWPAEKRARAIRHEFAHVERRDWLWQCFGKVITAVFWFHPLAWLATAELRREAECAADDAVLSSGADAAEYAAQLLDVARRLNGAVPSVAVAMVRRPALAFRVASILDPARPRTRAGLGARTSIIAGIIALLISCTFLQAAKVHKIGEPGLTPPKVASKTEPQYTPEAREAKIEGTTVLTLVINENGLADNLQVQRSLDPGLDQKAIEAVQQWRFEPGRLEDKAVAVMATIEINWRLQ
jgi:TonB family protein